MPYLLSRRWRFRRSGRRRALFVIFSNRAKYQNGWNAASEAIVECSGYDPFLNLKTFIRPDALAFRLRRGVRVEGCRHAHRNGPNKLDKLGKREACDHSRG